MNTETAALVLEAFALLRVQNFFELSRAYTREDQKLMKSKEWDPNNPELITNKVKEVLERINPGELDDQDRSWWNEILWFWNHHAISYAIWEACNQDLAQMYADAAIRYQTDDHPNSITRLLWHLVRDRVDEAWKTVDHWPQGGDDVELETARELLLEYENGSFFRKRLVTEHWHP